MDNNNLLTAYYAGGCFWGLEFLFENLDGVISAKSGYMGGFIDNPTYKQVCYEKTGHLETVATDRVKPNGLAFNLDESILYVSDTAISHDEKGWHHIFAYDVIDGIELALSLIHI